jgi:hypothetical protein
MLWADSRQTTREEDKAYSLLGIFGVFMPLIYGEGQDHAIKRLEQEIYKRSKNHLPTATLGASKSSFNNYGLANLNAETGHGPQNNDKNIFSKYRSGRKSCPGTAHLGLLTYTNCILYRPISRYGTAAIGRETRLAYPFLSTFLLNTNEEQLVCNLSAFAQSTLVYRIYPQPIHPRVTGSFIPHNFSSGAIAPNF